MLPSSSSFPHPSKKRRDGGRGVCSARTPQAPWGRVEDEINLYLSVGCEQPQAAIAPKALMLYSEKTHNNPFQCLVVLTGFAVLLTSVTHIANAFFCTYESVEERVCNLFMRRAGKLLNL